MVGQGVNRTTINGAEISIDTMWYFNAEIPEQSLSVVALHRIHSAENDATESPAYRGCQTSAVSGGKFSTRFVATVDSLEYKEVGFEITVTDYNGQSGELKVYDTNTVFSSIVGSDTVGGTVTYTAQDLGGTYIYALSVNNIYTNYPVTFRVTPYHIATDGTERIPSTSYLVTVSNGNVVSQTVAE